MSGAVPVLRRFRRDTTGAMLVELAVVMPLFLLMIFGILEYGRLYWNESTAQKAMQIAARLASVRPPVCGAAFTPIGAVAPPSGSPAPRYGSLCRSGNICQSQARNCDLSAPTATATEIWNRIRPLLPPGTQPQAVTISYTDGTPNLSFLGGPYTPVVTAELVGACFQFVIPIHALGALASGTSNPTTPPCANSGIQLPGIALPSMSVSVPGEDLDVGTGS